MQRHEAQASGPRRRRPSDRLDTRNQETSCNSDSNSKFGNKISLKSRKSTKTHPPLSARPSPFPHHAAYPFLPRRETVPLPRSTLFFRVACQLGIRSRVAQLHRRNPNAERDCLRFFAPRKANEPSWPRSAFSWTVDRELYLVHDFASFNLLVIYSFLFQHPLGYWLYYLAY